ncbi:MAG: proline--tRNA ligase [Roseiflexaceae bacterium]
MRMSVMLGRTLREPPAEAEGIAHQLVLRAGLARATQAGSFALLPLGMRVLRRIEAIMHEELAAIAAQELRTPVVQTSTIWEQSGRYAAYGPQMLRATDRGGRALLVAPTHEEAIADLARREINSYRQLPALVYQIHTKYRDEQRSKGGLLRMREFTMLDAYSLDSDHHGLAAVYERVGVAFERILQRCGLSYIAVAASAGEMGGSTTTEYHVRSSTGEDELMLCAACGYAANREVAHAQISPYSGTAPAMREVFTPNCATIAEVATFLDVPETATAKAVFFDTPERGLVFAVVRGDAVVSEAKLRAAAGVSALTPASTEQISAAGAVAGYASPVGLTVASAATTGVFVVADRAIPLIGPLVAGANRAGYHLCDTLYGRDWHATLVADIAEVQAGDPCPQCGAPLAIETGVEVGHIFQLGTRYAEAIGARFLDRDGSEKPIVMGSYGLGLERIMQLIIEQHHDSAGIIWPAAVAPFDIHLLRLGKSEALHAAAEQLYQQLQQQGKQVLFDDRGESAGIMFNDADLIGIPLRILISDRTLAAGEAEIKPRGGTAQRVPLSSL